MQRYKFFWTIVYFFVSLLKIKKNMQFKPFRQIPYWDADQTFEINSEQMQAIQEMYKTLALFSNAFEPFFFKNLTNEKIKIRYEDEFGNLISKEDVDKMMNDYANYLKENEKSNVS